MSGPSTFRALGNDFATAVEIRASGNEFVLVGP
jgi:hypothetical protein